MRSKLVRGALLLAVASLSLSLLGGCEMFVDDGDEAVGVNSRGGYFYFLDNDADRLVMMDAKMNVVHSWPYSDFTTEDFVQGVTFDGNSLWVSVSGGDDLIRELDLSAGEEIVVLRSLPAPPDGQGAVRDIAWDGSTFWALNSGSATYGNPPQLFQIDPLDGTVLASYDLPSPAPRGLCHVGPNSDVYGAGAPEGCYYTDKDDDRVYRFDTVYNQFDDAFAAPVGPRGDGYVYPLGICFDGVGFWSTNSSGVADYLFALDYEGRQIQYLSLPSEQPGAIVWTDVDLKTPKPPTILGAYPNTGSPGGVKTVTVSGRDFRDGIAADFGAGVTVDSLTYVDATEAVVYISIAADAALGLRDIALTNPDGQSGVGVGLFQVVEFDPSVGYLWILDNGSNLLLRYALATGEVVRSYATEEAAPGGSLQGLAYDGTDIWLSAAGSDDIVARIDTTGGTLAALQTFTAPPAGAGVARDMAFDGTHLWVPNSDSDEIYRLDPTSGAVVDTIAAPGGDIRGVVWADGRLYGNDIDTDTVYVWDDTAESWSAAFTTPTPPNGDESDRYPTGMTWDGYNFWICNSTGIYDWIFQVSPDGTLLSTVEVPDAGDAQPTGIVFTQD